MNDSSLWRPLRTTVFRNLLIADVISDIGTFMQSVGAAWLMVSLGAGPMYVALTQTASSLPFFLLALPAGSAGDIFDRRKLILCTEAWMACVALVLAVLTIGGFMTTWLLLHSRSLSRCYGNTHLASRSSRVSAQRRSAGGLRAQRNRIQPRSSGRTGAGWCTYRGRRHCRCLCGECGVLLGSLPCDRAMEKADSQADDTA